ncbi:MAG TPA: dihydrolipoamide acetyltransferase family protein [Chloroflexia bacterium]|nr:dihydrolipoamide acetyltransferase family protein [Chloroflexia bacterium]
MANLAKVTMPQLGESVTEGTIGAWLKKPGEKIEKYESLAEVVTDKVNAEIPSPYTGTIKELLVPENEPVPIGTLICTIETEIEVADTPAGHDAPAPAAAAPAPAPAQPVAATPPPAPAPAPAPAAPPPAPVAATATATAVAAPPAPAAGAGGNGAGAKRLSPAVARLLEEHNLELSQIPGTGFEGRVTKVDIERYLEQRAAGTLPAPAPAQPAAPAPAQPLAAAAAAPAPPVAGSGMAAAGMRSPYEPSLAPAPAAQAAPPPPAPVAPVFEGPGDQLVPLTQMRKAIAEHMVRSVHTSPHAWTYVEIDMHNVMQYRARIKDPFRQREGRDPSVLAFGIMALAQALRQHPAINSVWSDQGTVLKREINVGIPIDLGDQGLIVPVVHGADAQSFIGLTRSVSDLATRARAGKLRVDDLQGSTVTLNNAGTFGSMMSMPILNQPNVVNITMEAIVKRPVVLDGDAIAIRPMMNMCCSFDHRVLDGAQVGRFLQTMKRLLEGFTDAGLGY